MKIDKTVFGIVFFVVALVLQKSVSIMTHLRSGNKKRSNEEVSSDIRNYGNFFPKIRLFFDKFQKVCYNMKT